MFKGFLLRNNRYFLLLLILLLLFFYSAGCESLSPDESGSNLDTEHGETQTPTIAVFSFTTSVDPQGSGGVTPATGEVQAGTLVTISAEPNFGYIFDHWSGGDSGIVSELDFVVNENIALTAHFAKVSTIFTIDPALGNDVPSQTASVLIDLENDGDLDLVLGRIESKDFTSLEVYLNQGQGQFIKSTESFFEGTIPAVTSLNGMAVGDVNGDGLQDLLLADSGEGYAEYNHRDAKADNIAKAGQSRILIQTEEGQLVDMTEDWLPQERRFTSGIYPGDVNGNGALDLVMVNIEVFDMWLDMTNFDMALVPAGLGSSIYLNDGTGQYQEDLTRLPWNVNEGKIQFLSAKLIDVENDGDLDLFLGVFHDPSLLPWGSGNDLKDTDLLLVNNGNGVYLEAPQDSIPPRPGGQDAQTYAIESADFNQDGWQDLILSTASLERYRPHLQLLINNGDGTFRDESTLIKQHWSYSMPGCSPVAPKFVNRLFIVDANNDTWPDILTQGNCLPHLLFTNLAGESFYSTENYSNLGIEVQSLLPGDLNGDGLLDITLISYGAIGSLLRVQPDSPGADHEPVFWIEEGGEIIQLAAAPDIQPTPTPTPDPSPCKAASEVTRDDIGETIKVCGEVTNFGQSDMYIPYAFLKLDGEFLIISYDWAFNSEWLGGCLLIEDEVEDLTGVPVFKLGRGEGYAGSECYTDSEGRMICSEGQYFQNYDGCVETISEN